jgi:hypothetical protein
VHDSETTPSSPDGLRAEPLSPASAPGPPLDAPGLQAHFRKLDREIRDVGGRLLHAGTLVLVNPVAPDEVAEDTPANRRAFIESGYAWSPAARAKLWFRGPDAISSGVRDQLAAEEGTKQRFLAAIAENDAKLMRDTLLADCRGWNAWSTGWTGGLPPQDTNWSISRDLRHDRMHSGRDHPRVFAPMRRLGWTTPKQ